MALFYDSIAFLMQSRLIRRFFICRGNGARGFGSSIIISLRYLFLLTPLLTLGKLLGRTLALTPIFPNLKDTPET